MMHTSAVTKRLSVPTDGLVLEIGSGHRPHRRADVLTDRYLEDIERGGKLVTDRPFVQADAQELPFRPGVFDYVICRHVLEHLDYPALFFSEISRVGRAGYIEAPSAVWERLHPTRVYHKWYILEIDRELVMVRKPPEEAGSIFGHLFETLSRYSPEYRLFLRRYADLFYVRHEWQDQVKWSVDPADAQLRAWFVEPWDTDKANRFVSPRSQGQQALDLLSGVWGSLWGGLLRRLGSLRREPRRRAVGLAPLLQCPKCSGIEIEVRDGRARCSACEWHTVVVVPK